MWVHSLAAVKVLLKLELYIIIHVVAYSELSIGHLKQVFNQVHLPWGGGVGNGCLQPPSPERDFN